MKSGGCAHTLVAVGAVGGVAVSVLMIIGNSGWWWAPLAVSGLLFVALRAARPKLHPATRHAVGAVVAAPTEATARIQVERRTPSPQQVAPKGEREAVAARSDRRLRVRMIETDGLKVVDLRHLDSMRTRIVGSGYNVDDAEREHYSAMSYLLIPEPDNPADKRAIAVYSKGRRLGYVSAKRASMMQPLLAKIDADAFLVAGTGITPNSIVMFLDLPRVPALREFAELRPS